MKTRRQHAGEDALTISRRSTQSLTSIENSETIPNDLINEILLRLPAKSIARCRCVLKVWASILRRTDFTELFMTRSWTRPQILFSCAKNGEVFFFSTPQVRNPDENSFLVAGNHHHMKFPLNHTSQIRAPVRGFVCLTHSQISNERQETVPVICNPSTGQVIPLPEVKTQKVHVIIYLGFDPIGKKFKLLSMTMKEKIVSEYQVLTLGTQNLSWRKIECCISCQYPRANHDAKDGICIDGCLYYVAVLIGPPMEYGIASFDIRSEKFTFIEGADGMPLWTYLTLVNYKGRLCALSSDGIGLGYKVTRETKWFELWVLVDAEKHEWSKHIYIVPPMWKNVVADAGLYFVGMTDTYEIVLSTPHISYPFYIYYYSIEKNTVTRVEIQGMDAFQHCKVHTSLNHVEDVKLLQYV